AAAGAGLERTAVYIDFTHTGAELAVDQHRRGVRVTEHERRMRGRRPEAVLDAHRDEAACERGATAIDDQALRAVRKLDGKRGSTPVARVLRQRRRRGVELQHALASNRALIAPLARIAQRARTNA